MLLMEKIIAIRIVLFIIGSLFVLIALYLFTRKKEGNKAPRLIVAAIIVFLLQSSGEWFVTTGIEFLSEYIPEFIYEIIFEEDSVAEGANQTEHSHSVADTKKENIQEPDCTSGGSYEQIEICECGEVINHKTYEVDALGHDYNTTTIPATCTEDGYMVHICERCGDEFTDNPVAATGHSYIDGICVNCGGEDPDYEKQYSESDIVKILNDQIVSNSGAYKCYMGAESVSVFAEDRYNCFSIRTLVSYNLWGHNIQNVKFNASKLNDLGAITFKIGGATGCSGNMSVDIFIDKDIDDAPDYTYEIEASGFPIEIEPIDVSNAVSIAIQVSNHSSNENTLVFFDFKSTNVG